MSDKSRNLDESLSSESLEAGINPNDYMHKSTSSRALKDALNHGKAEDDEAQVDNSSNENAGQVDDSHVGRDKGTENK